MPRDSKTLIPATSAPGFALTPSDHIFLDEVDRLLHLALDRLGDVLESIKPLTKYDFPAPHVLRDPDAPVPQPNLSFVPYGRDFLRSVKGLQTLCNLWVMLKTTRPQPKPGTAELQLGSPSPNPNQGNAGIPACDSPRSPANPALVAMVEKLFKDDPKPTPQRP